MFDVLSRILELGWFSSEVRQAARNRASPTPVVRGRSVLALVAVVAGAALAYPTLAAAAPGLAVPLMVALGASAAMALILAGNQLDAALARRRLAKRQGERLARKAEKRARRARRARR